MGPHENRLQAPAVQKNQEPIREVLKEFLPASGTVLELASGSGEHIIHFAENLPDLTWLPSEIDPAALASIEAWRQYANFSNIHTPVTLDVTSNIWALPETTGELVGVLAINLIHIAPWEACEGLMRGSASRLPTNGILYLYGPYKRSGRHTAPSNHSFDKLLRRHDPEWGVRNLESVINCARNFDLALDQIVEMPSNNLSIILRNFRGGNG